VQDVCEIHVRIGHAHFLSGKLKTDGYSALITVSFEEDLGSFCIRVGIGVGFCGELGNAGQTDAWKVD
jgi:hypothetical protein